MKLKALVLVEDYPSKSSHAMMYVHVRNKFYIKNNIELKVLNFRSRENYNYENIDVITRESYSKDPKQYDLLICHAANLKHHYKFLNKYADNFKRIIFFFHGHEILKLNETYPKDYDFIKSSKLKKYIRIIYDNIKLVLWKKKIEKLLPKTHLIFVSRWLYDRFLYYVHINPKKLENHVSIINNSVGEIFENKHYDLEIPKKYDFITIRGSSIDKSKYGIDMICKLAINNPLNKFLIIGKGEYFKYNEKPKNVHFIDKILNHQDMLEYLNKSRCALLMTRQDTQGVVTCEMATYGMPTITSDIEICREIFADFNNVKLIGNDCNNTNLNEILENLEKKNSFKKNEKYFAKNTIKKEIDLFNDLMW